MLFTLDDAVEAIVRLRKAQKEYNEAKNAKSPPRPLVIYGLYDPAWVEFSKGEEQRKERLFSAKNELRSAARHLQEVEIYLADNVLPVGVWVLHIYHDREFAIGMARACGSFALQVIMIRDDSDIENLYDLIIRNRNKRVCPEWEAAMFDMVRGA